MSGWSFGRAFTVNPTQSFETLVCRVVRDIVTRFGPAGHRSLRRFSSAPNHLPVFMADPPSSAISNQNPATENRNLQLLYPLVKSSDTPELVCLQEFAVRPALQSSYQRICSARPRNMPTNSGSRACRPCGTVSGMTSDVQCRVSDSRSAASLLDVRRATLDIWCRSTDA